MRLMGMGLRSEWLLAIVITSTSVRCKQKKAPFFGLNKGSKLIKRKNLNSLTENLITIPNFVTKQTAIQKVRYTFATVLAKAKKHNKLK
jgi:hypothetical protein